MPESDVSPQFAQLFRDKVAEGDLAWVRDHFQSGRLNFLRDHITTEERGQFASRLAKGDMPWLRQVLARVDVPGAGPLSTAVGSIPAAPSLTTPPDPATATGFAPPTGEIPATMAQPPVVQSLGANATVPPIAEIPSAPSAPVSVPPVPPVVVPPIEAAPTLLNTLVPPADHVEPAAAIEADTEHVVTTTTKRKRPLLPILVALAVVGVGLYWLLNRNNDSPKTSATTVKTATVTTKAVGSSGATTAPVATTAPATTTAPAAPVIETLQAAGNHKTLLAALQSTGLTDTLKTGGPYTVFAPTDAAFAQLPPGTLEKLLTNKDALTKVLLFHVSPGNLGPADLKSGPLPSLEGDPLTIQVEGTNVIVNSVAATSNPQAPAIYSIDKVLLPPNGLPAEITTPAATAAPVATTVAPAPPTTTPPTTTAPAGATTAAPTTAPATTAPPRAGVEKVSVFFNASSSSLTQEATVILKDVAKKIKAAGPKAAVKITGYADNRGTPDNIAIVSRERAQRVADYLISLGVQADYKIVAGGALPGTDYDQARRTDIELG
jgi:uncharacterized surface protein with fasciclin (FAS1) repeats